MVNHAWTSEKDAALNNIMLSMIAAVHEAEGAGVVCACSALRNDMAELSRRARELSTVLLWAEKHRGGK